MVKVVKGNMEAEESGSDLAILIYRASPIRPDPILPPIHQNLHANLEISREAQVAHKEAQGDHYERKAKKVQVPQQFQSVRFQLDPKKTNPAESHRYIRPGIQNKPHE